jgi:hypothetical protein
MESTQIALVVIVALLVGVLIPAIVQFQGAMRGVSRLIRHNEREVHQAVREIARISEQLGRLGTIAQARSKEIDSFITSLSEAGQTVRKLGSTLKTASMIGAAVGPVVAAAVRARQNGASTDDQPELALDRANGMDSQSALQRAVSKQEENRT